LTDDQAELISGHRICEQKEVPLGARIVEYKKYITDMLGLL